MKTLAEILTQKARENNYQTTIINPLSVPNTRSMSNEIIEIEKIGKSKYAPHRQLPMPIPNQYSYSQNQGLPQFQVNTSLEEFKKRYYRALEYDKKNLSDRKDKIILNPNANLSEAFKNILGLENTSNIQGIDDITVENELYGIFVENEAVRLYSSKENKSLNELLTPQLLGMHVETASKNGRFYWKIGYGCEIKEGVISFLQTLFTTPRMDAVATLANVMGLRKENFFAVHSIDTRVAETTMVAPNIKDIPKYLLPSVGSGNALAILENTTYIYGHSKQIIGAFLTYSFDGIFVTIPASVVRGVMTIGKYKSPAFLLNQDKIDSNPYAIIIFFLNIQQAIVFDKMVQESPKLTDADVIITGFIGRNLSPVSWNYFYNRQVILICATDVGCYSRVKEYMKRLETVSLKSFRSYPYPLLHAKSTKEPNSSSLEELSPLEAELVKEAVDLSKVELVSKLIEGIEHKSLSYDEYVSWGEDMGLFKGKDPKPSQQLQYQPPSFTLSEDADIATKLEDVCSESLFSSDEIIMIHGKKGTTKSLCGLGIVKGLSTGSPVFGFKTTGCNTKVLLIDSETPPDVFSARAKQFRISNDKSINLIPKRLVENEPWKNLDLMNEEHRCVFEHHINDYKPKVIIFDNLTSLVKNSSLYSPETTKSIFNWSETLLRKGITVIFVHHTLDDGNKVGTKMRGSDEWRIRCQTEIQLIGTNEFSLIKNLPENVLEYAEKEGNTVAMRINSSKSCPCLDGKIIWLYLGFGSSKWERICVTNSDGEELSFTNPTRENTPENIMFPTSVIGNLYDNVEVGTMPVLSDASTNDVSLTDEEKDMLTLFSTRQSIRREDIDNLLGCKESKSQNILKSLIEKEKIERQGSGKAINYILRQQ